MRVAICPEWPGYVISDDGRVQGPRGWWLTPASDRDGYLKITTYIKGARRNAYVHQMVCTAFHGSRPEGLQVRHLNGVHSDNRSSNLAWGTPEENRADQDVHGTTYRGERHHRAKLDARKVREIRTRYAGGGVSQPALAREYGVSQQSILNIIHEKTWKEV